ncbi:MULTISPECIES: glycosyltransferase family 2 protein [Microcystis]|uniref:Glycosyltransferase family 2 protein n=1 Tax=Microcystis wesenbergii NRERC-220 TaxID=3068991 RepID=A0ABU3HLG8_9CHRO|nr:glycosyltransferase family 2 protein [Microcystis wesenbergii]MBD2116252.1 glycosyltransferase [Microcystis wesenbergii FACHB-1339]MDT3674570.1 glycosyltransferase family 2 protein [Microcystis wesenbergii NRERC-220]
MKIINLNHNFSTTRKLTSDPLQYPILSPPNPERKGEGGLRTKGYFKRSYDEASGLSDNSPLPLVTIITVVFNGEKYLEQTIQSVINQTYDNVEYIVIDGGSTDGTVEIIHKYEDAIDYWLSEPDQGLYFAMNKAISLAMGEIIGNLNCGDWYELDAIQNSVLALNDSQADYAYGSVYLVNQKGERIGKFSAMTGEKLNQSIYYVQPYPHISAFVKKLVYLQEGSFNTKYKVAADHEFSLRIHTKNYQGVEIKKVLGNIRPGGLSGKIIAKEESRDIAIEYGVNKTYAYLLFLYYTINSYLVKILPHFLVKLVKNLKNSRFGYE